MFRVVFDHIKRLAVLTAGALLLSACSGSSAIDRADAGRTIAYEPGVPNFDMESLVRLTADSPVVDIYYSIPISSLIFLQSDSKYAAEYEVIIQLRDRETGEAVSEELETKSLTVSTYDSTVSHRPLTELVTMPVSPGDYVADVSITDLASGSTVRRRQAVTVEAPNSQMPYISRLLIEGIRSDGEFEPIVSLHLPAMMDSLRASVQLYNLSDQQNLEVSLRLLEYKSDTTVASPPYWLIPTRASLQFRGVDYDEADTVQVSHRPLRSVDESAVVEISLPALPKGIYRVVITATDTSGENILERERLLSIKNSSFPSLTSLDDLVEALAYIAFENEIEEIREASTPVEKKRRFDAFWGSLVSNRNLAANLLKLYYGRIEEANLFFTGHKEGWKTDRGMIYTIFGPPIYVERRVELEVWHYSYGDRNPAQTFVFEKAIGDPNDPFETFILQRRPYYQHEWSRALDRWREGDVL